MVNGSTAGIITSTLAGATAGYIVATRKIQNLQSIRKSALTKIVAEGELYKVLREGEEVKTCTDLSICLSGLKDKYIWIDSGVYKTSTIRITDEIVISGLGILKSKTGIGFVMEIKASNVSINGIKIDGSKELVTSEQSSHLNGGIYIEGSNIEIDGVDVYNTDGHGIFIYNSSYVRISNSILRDISYYKGHDGIAIHGSTDIVIHGSNFYNIIALDNYGGGVEILDGDQYPKPTMNIAVVGNTFKNIGEFGVGIATPLDQNYRGYPRNITIVGNTFIDCGIIAGAVTGYAGRSVVIADNTIIATQELPKGIYLFWLQPTGKNIRYVEKSVISGNFVHGHKDGIHFKANKIVNPLISSHIVGNYVSTTDRGIVIEFADRSSVVDNEIESPIGVHLQVSGHVLVAGNKIKSSNIGIYIDDSYFCKITSNYIDGETGKDSIKETSGNNNVISENYIRKANAPSKVGAGTVLRNNDIF